jgi:L-threonylcarbamoyladenylate synthase
VADVPVVSVDLHRPAPAILARAARLLRDGEVVAAPSDTVYGFLALPRSVRARDGLARLKERSGPFLVLISSWEEARSWTRGVSGSTWQRLREVWPGPVTVILPAEPSTPGSEGGGIGMRMPGSAFLRRVLSEVGEPLFSTSANHPGEPAPTEARQVAAAFGEGIALILDGGPAGSGVPSTVVDLVNEPPRVLRDGLGNAAPLLDRENPAF